MVEFPFLCLWVCSNNFQTFLKLNRLIILSVLLPWDKRISVKTARRFLSRSGLGAGSVAPCARVPFADGLITGNVALRRETAPAAETLISSHPVGGKLSIVHLFNLDIKSFFLAQTNTPFASLKFSSAALETEIFARKSALFRKGSEEELVVLKSSPEALLTRAGRSLLGRGEGTVCPWWLREL